MAKKNSKSKTLSISKVSNKLSKHKSILNKLKRDGSSLESSMSGVRSSVKKLEKLVANIPKLKVKSGKQYSCMLDIGEWSYFGMDSVAPESALIAKSIDRFHSGGPSSTGLGDRAWRGGMTLAGYNPGSFNNDQVMFIHLTNSPIEPGALIEVIELSIFSSTKDADTLVYSIYFENREFGRANWTTMYQHVDIKPEPGDSIIRAKINKDSLAGYTYHGKSFPSDAGKKRYLEGLAKDNYETRLAIRLSTRVTTEEDATDVTNKLRAVRVKYTVPIIDV
jgi:hypothetical protein